MAMAPGSGPGRQWFDSISALSTMNTRKEINKKIQSDYPVGSILQSVNTGTLRRLARHNAINSSLVYTIKADREIKQGIKYTDGCMVLPPGYHTFPSAEQAQLVSKSD